MAKETEYGKGDFRDLEANPPTFENVFKEESFIEKDVTSDVLTTYYLSEANGVDTKTSKTFTQNNPHNINGGAMLKSNQDLNGTEVTESGETSELNQNNKVILALCTFAVSLTTLSFSIISPFFPQEAEKKGMSIVLTGLVFSIHPAIIFLTSPIYGAFLTKLGPKQVHLGGILIGGVGTVLFGLLDHFPDGTFFAVASIACRTIGAFGFSAFNTASFAIVSEAFRDNMGFAFGILETGVGLGYVIGPALGGTLYGLGGFGLSFYVVGFLVLINGLLIFKILPNIDKKREERKGSVFQLFQSPMVVVPMLSVFVGSMGVSTTDSTLARHMEPFGLEPFAIGMFFMILSFTHTICAPVVGYVTEKKNIQAPLMIAGSSICFAGFLILGPSILLPFLPFKMTTIAIGLVCNGMSLSCALIPTMKCMMIGAIELGLEDSIDTYALVSGLFVSTHCLGGITGPLGVGSLVQEYGYPTAYTCIAMLNLGTMLVSLVYFTSRHVRNLIKASKTRRCRCVWGTDKSDYTSLN